MTSNAIFEMDFDIRLKQDLFKPIEKTQTIFQRLKENFNIGND